MNVQIPDLNLHNTGLTLVANYTWAHSLDDLSETFSDSLQGASNGIGDLGYTSLANPRLDWGSSDYDVRNRIVISPIWETPCVKIRPRRRVTLGGWTIADIFTARSGLPFSVFDYTYDENFYTVPAWYPPRRLRIITLERLNLPGRTSITC